MYISVIGLGLIGGSICKALKLNTNHRINGVDTDSEVLRQALGSGAIDCAEDVLRSDIIIVCVHPDAAVEYILKHYKSFKKGCIVCDVCGVKGSITDRVDGLLCDSGLHYVGGHPMAGKERSGFANSDAQMFKGASFVITTTGKTAEHALKTVKQLAENMGFVTVITTAKQHDRIIAYTSQLAHVVSSSYVKSPTMGQEAGFTGGSFQDMTRVAYLDENLWTAIFLHNADNLVFELDTVIKNLTQYKNAIASRNESEIKRLLLEGKNIKEKNK